MSGYSYQWSLFADWCDGTDVEALPASPITLAEFLDDNPAGQAVQLRRVSAINRAHLDAGHPAPGRVTSIRMALDSARSDRTIRRADQYRVIAAGLPILGSTPALFGRRDAVLLVLAGAGLSYRAIAGLDRVDITTDGDSVWIGGRHRVRVAPNDAAGFEPATIWHRWNSVLQFSEHYPSTTLLAEHLQRNTFPAMTALPVRGGPVAVPIDRWGHLPLPVTAMTAAEVGAVIARHRIGVSPLHTPRRPIIRPSDSSVGLTRSPLRSRSRRSSTPGTTARVSTHVAARTRRSPMYRIWSTTSKTASSNSYNAPCNSSTRPRTVIAPEKANSRSATIGAYAPCTSR